MRFIVKWISQLLLVVGALCAGEWSLFDFFGFVRPDGQIRIGSVHGPKVHIELEFRFLIVIVAIGLIIVADIVDIYLPRKELRRFRSEYLDVQCEIWYAELFKEKSVRVSVLYARRRWYWPLWKIFDWAWSTGFEPPWGHQDVNMPLACWQGVSGQAYHTGVSKNAFFETPSAPMSFKELWLLRNPFRFTAFQIRKTSIVTGIISIPILRKEYGDSPSYKSVGVITLDAYSPEAAQFLKQNNLILVEYFFRIGKLLGSLDM